MQTREIFFFCRAILTERCEPPGVQSISLPICLALQRRHFHGRCRAGLPHAGPLTVRAAAVALFVCPERHSFCLPALGGRSASTAGREGVLPEQEDEAAAGPDRGEGHASRRNQGHERHAGGQREEDQRPSEEGEEAPPAGQCGPSRFTRERGVGGFSSSRSRSLHLCPQLNQSARGSVKWRLSQSLCRSHGEGRKDGQDVSASPTHSLCAGVRVMCV